MTAALRRLYAAARRAVGADADPTTLWWREYEALRERREIRLTDRAVREALRRRKEQPCR